MGTIFPRKDSRFLWLGYVDATGKRRMVSSGSEDRAVAKKLLAAIERKVKAQVAAGVREVGPLTVKRYFERWLEARTKLGVKSVKNDRQRLRDHAIPVLGAERLEDVRPRHLIALVRALEAKELSPRSIHHVYGLLRVMFGEAVREEVIAATPCVLRVRRGELPKKRDKNPGWRPRAIFSRGEVEQLISDERIPAQRRVVYALRFIAGLRPGEVPTLTWADYEREVEPLGRLLVVSSVDSSTGKAQAGTKTGGSRAVPVHPTLAKVLAAWRLSGWSEYQGRAPKPEDLIVPGSTGEMLKLSNGYKRFQADLLALGMRRRRQHDTRRTFISQARADGARGEVLKWVTHPPDTEVFEGYTTFTWETLCEEVRKLKVTIPERKLLRMPVAAGASAATAELREAEGAEMTTGNSMSREGLEPSNRRALMARPAPRCPANRGVAGRGGGRSPRDGAGERSNVAGKLSDYEQRAKLAGFTVSPPLKGGR